MPRPPAIIGIGRNYAKHAAELGNERPDAPLIFHKNPASVIGNDEPIIIPRICQVPDHGVDYEGELAVYIGCDCRDVSKTEALDMVSHYGTANDISHRWWQWEGSGGQFCRGKSFDTFCPLGQPVPASEIPDPANLAITTHLNGQLVQDSSTSQMLFSVPDLISDLSRGTTLLKGTVILTGTPAGVGAAQDPPRFLMDGDLVEVSIGGLHSLRNSVVQESA